MSDGTSHSVPPLSTRTGEAVTNNSRFLYAAIACGAVPLVVGSLIYWTWRATRWDWLPFAGMMTVFVGFAFFLFGAIAALVYAARESRVDRPRRMPLGGQLLLVAALLFANFPVAIWYAKSAVDFMAVYMVTVVNQSDRVIDNFVIQGGGMNVDVGPIPVGASASRQFQFVEEDQLTFSATQQDSHFDGIIEGRVTGSLEGLTFVYVKPDAKVEIQRVLD